MRGRDDTLLNESVFENRNTLFLRIDDIYVLLDRTHEVGVRSRVGSGVDEVLELVLSGFEVLKRVLEASDFLDGQFYGTTLPLLSCSPSAGWVAYLERLSRRRDP